MFERLKSIVEEYNNSDQEKAVLQEFDVNTGKALILCIITGLMYRVQSTLYKCTTHKSTSSLNTPLSSVPRLGLSVKCTPSVFTPCNDF